MLSEAEVIALYLGGLLASGLYEHRRMRTAHIGGSGLLTLDSPDRKAYLNVFPDFRVQLIAVTRTEEELGPLKPEFVDFEKLHNEER
jgi:hypothetical protein